MFFFQTSDIRTKKIATIFDENFCLSTNRLTTEKKSFGNVKTKRWTLFTPRTYSHQLENTWKHIKRGSWKLLVQLKLLILLDWLTRKKIDLEVLGNVSNGMFLEIVVLQKVTNWDKKKLHKFSITPFQLETAEAILMASTQGRRRLPILFCV